ncbi:hypothetical protein T439DRAFT_325616 [Meredithblackwellia eburnea MCA 4105]
MSENARQTSASHNFILSYQYIWCGVIGLLTIRNLVIRFNHHQTHKRIQTQSSTSQEEKGSSGASPAKRPPSLATRFESWIYHPIFSGSSVSLWTPLRIFIILALVGVNVGFILAISTDTRPPLSVYNNTPHSVAIRCGFMALAQSPWVFALTGRNSLVTFLTGISAQHLRFLHKSLGYTWFLLAFTHFMGVILNSFHWSGAAGPQGLFTQDFARWGAVTISGLFVIVTFSLPIIRRHQYEVFIVSHIIGAAVVLTGIHYHAPELRAWSYAALGFWVLERFLRLLQLFSLTLLAKFQARSPIILCKAELVHGAIIVRAPIPRGGWSAGQFAFLRILDGGMLKRYPNLIFQAHPFSIANVPDSAGGGTPSMLFVIRVRGGMTKSLANYLERQGGTSDLRLAVEGPYGHREKVELYQDILLVAGGSGITHVKSLLADIIHKAKGVPRGRSLNVRLIWVVQHLAQADWVMEDLISTVDIASSSNIKLTVSFFVTRDSLSATASVSSAEALLASEKVIRGGRSNSVTGAGIDRLLLHPVAGKDVSIIAGRADVGKEVKEFVEGNAGDCLIAACGPIAITEDVRDAVAHLSSSHRVALSIASFEC